MSICTMPIISGLIILIVENRFIIEQGQYSLREYLINSTDLFTIDGI